MTQRQRIAQAARAARDGVVAGYVVDADGVRVPIGARPGAVVGVEASWVAADGIEVWRWGSVRLRVVRGEVLDGRWTPNFPLDGARKA